MVLDWGLEIILTAGEIYPPIRASIKTGCRGKVERFIQLHGIGPNPTHISYMFVRIMRVTARHQYCHSNTRLHCHGTTQPAPFPFVLVSFFNQSITILPDGSGSSHSSICILVYTDSARFDTG
jgi:hypothetical protein